MVYCHKCGKRNNKEDSFCEHCGEHIKELLKETEEEAEKVVKKTSYAGLVIFIIFIILIGYIILDFWAVSQITPQISLDNLVTIISSFSGSAGYTSASGSTKIIFENPTFVPIFMFPVNFNAGYDNTDILTGKTGIIFIPPYSSNEVSAETKVSYVGAGSSLVQGFINVLTGNNKEHYIDFYELGIKFASIRG